VSFGSHLTTIAAPAESLIVRSMQGPANPDSRKAVKRRKDEAARRPQRHGAGLGDEIEAASLAPSSRQRAGGKRSRPQDEDEARSGSCSGRAHCLCRVLLESSHARTPPFLTAQLLTRGLSNKVLLQAREQRDEIEEEERRQGRCARGGCWVPCRVAPQPWRVCPTQRDVSLCPAETEQASGLECGRRRRWATAFSPPCRPPTVTRCAASTLCGAHCAAAELSAMQEAGDSDDEAAYEQEVVRALASCTSSSVQG
jgi:hypothetical protein